MTSGYSGAPLAKKLSLKDGMRIRWEGMPPSVSEEILVGGVQLHELGPPIDAAHIFVTERYELEAKLHDLKPLLAPSGHLGELAQEGIEASDRHHRGHHPRNLPSDGPGRREGLRNRRDLVRPQADDPEGAASRIVANKSH